jgi:hypothetical protein
VLPLERFGEALPHVKYLCNLTYAPCQTAEVLENSELENHKNQKIKSGFCKKLILINFVLFDVPSKRT